MERVNELPVLISGASGFLGNCLVKRLLIEDYSVVAVDRRPGIDWNGLKQRYSKKFSSIILDLDQPIENNVFDGQEYLTVFHLASYVPSFKNIPSISEMELTHRGVLIPTINLLNAIRGRTKYFLLSSSVSVYGHTQSGTFDETQPCDPTDMYGVFKLACEGVCKCFSLRERMDLTILRFAQLYGTGEPHGIFLQRVFLPQAQKNGKIELVRGGRDQKDLLWIDDAVQAMIDVTKKRITGVYNISSGQGVSIMEIAKILKTINRNQLDIEINDDGSTSLSQIYDHTLATKKFAFQPMISIFEGLTKLCQP